MVRGSWVTCRKQRLQMMASLLSTPRLGEHAQGATSRCLASLRVRMLLQCRSHSIPSEGETGCTEAAECMCC